MWWLWCERRTRRSPSRTTIRPNPTSSISCPSRPTPPPSSPPRRSRETARSRWGSRHPLTRRGLLPTGARLATLTRRRCVSNDSKLNMTLQPSSPGLAARPAMPQLPLPSLPHVLWAAESCCLASLSDVLVQIDLTKPEDARHNALGEPEALRSLGGGPVGYSAMLMCGAGLAAVLVLGSSPRRVRMM